jgi:photosystem II stability/assembly factor-like uncharacterized protein
MKRYLPAAAIAVLLLGLMPALSSATSAIAPFVASQRFVWQQPLPQGNPIRRVDFISDSVGWAVGDNGTVMKTTNGGWDWVNQAIPVPQGPSDRGAAVGDVCFLGDGQHGWVGAEGGVYRTVNGGTTWTETGAWSIDASSYPRYLFYNSLDFVDANNGWMVGGWELFRTRNGGSTVMTQAMPAIDYGSGPETFKPAYVDAADSVTAYAWNGAFQPGYIKTADSGASWVAKRFVGTSDASSYPDDIAVVDGQKVYAAVNGDLLKTTDGGSTWTTMTAMSRATGHTAYGLTLVDGDAVGDTLYVLDDNDGKLYKSTDGGTTWSAPSPQCDSYEFDAPSSTTLFSVGDAWVEYSTDLSSGFTPCRKVGTTDSYEAVDFTSEATGYAVGAGTYAQTSDGGAHWSVSDFNSTKGISSMLTIHFLQSDPAIGWIAGWRDDGGPTVLKTVNGGADWQSMEETRATQLRHMSFADATNGWACEPTYGRYWRSTDGGNTWVEVPHPGFHWGVDFVDANNGWIAFGSSEPTSACLLHTTNGGSTWTTQTVSGLQIAPYYIDFVDANNGYVADEFDNLFKTTNGGATWTEVGDAAFNSGVYDFRGIKFSTPLDGWVIGIQNTSSISPAYSHDFAAHTTDGGLTWDFYSDPVASDYGSTGTKISPIALDTFGANMWFVGGNGSILKTRPRPVATITSKSATLPNYGQSCVVTGTLTMQGAPLGGRRVELWSSGSTSGFVKTAITATTTASGTFSFLVAPTSQTYYRVKFLGDATTSSSIGGNYVRVMPSPWVGNPVAPATMSHTKYYSVYADLKPRHTSGSYPVLIYKEHKVAGVWKTAGYIKAKAANYSSYTRCTVAKIKLSSAGPWRLRAYHIADSGQVAKFSSGYDYVTVK